MRSVSCKNLTIFQNNESEAIEEEKITPFLYFTLQTTNGEGLVLTMLTIITKVKTVFSEVAAFFRNATHSRYSVYSQ